MCFEFVIDQFEIRNPTTAGDVSLGTIQYSHQEIHGYRREISVKKQFVRREICSLAKTFSSFWILEAFS
jgi:hypothetical protein